MFTLSPFSLFKTIENNVNSGLPAGVQLVNNFSRTMSPILEAYERQWYINIANYIGAQYVVWDRVSRRFIEPTAPTWRVRLVINKILPIARAQIAKLHELDPDFYVCPQTASDESAGGAKIGSQLVESLAKSQEFDEMYDELLHWLVITGQAWMFPAWDPMLGEQMELDEKDQNGQIVLGPDGMPVKKSVGMGDVVLDLCNPFEVIPDFSTSRIREMTAVIKRKIRSVDYVKDKYGVDVGSESIDMGNFQLMKAMATATADGVMNDIRPTLKDAVMVKTMYIQPNKQHPKGRIITSANNKLLFEDDLSSKIHGKLAIPSVYFGALPVPGRLLAMAPIENILPLQWKYNRGRSQIIEDINLMSRPKLIAATDSMQENTFTDQPGEILEVDPASGFEPYYLQPPMPSQTAMDNLNRLDQEMQDIGGIHDISLGRLPRRATSGIALNTLEEKDSTVIGPMKQSLKRGLERTFAFALSALADRCTEERAYKLMGKNDTATFIKFKGADLHSEDDVRVKIDNPFPQSRAARFEFAMDLVTKQIISAQSARKLIGLDSFTQFDDLLDQEGQRIAMEQAAAPRLQNAPMLGPEGEIAADASGAPIVHPAHMPPEMRSGKAHGGFKRPLTQ